MYNTPDVPDLDFSNLQNYVKSVQRLWGKKRLVSEIDLFVFSHSYPFEKLQNVVVGRYYVDSEIMLRSHVNHFKVVDLSNLYSIHQGMVASGNKKKKLSYLDFYYNRGLMLWKAGVNTRLASTHLVV